MLCTTGKTGGHGNTGLVEGGLGDIAQEGLVERLERLFGIGQHIPSGRLALVHTQIVITVDK